MRELLGYTASALGCFLIAVLVSLVYNSGNEHTLDPTAITRHTRDGCPIGYNIGDVIEHKVGAVGVIIRCRKLGVEVDTGQGTFFWVDATLVP